MPGRGAAWEVSSGLDTSTPRGAGFAGVAAAATRVGTPGSLPKPLIVTSCTRRRDQSDQCDRPRRAAELLRDVDEHQRRLRRRRALAVFPV
jgi:hypothetical protein